MHLNLQDKIIIVSNIDNGVGKSVVRLLIHENAIPVIITKHETGNVFINELAESNKPYFYLNADLINPAACKNVIDIILNKLGRIDGLINNNTLNTISVDSDNPEFFIQTIQQDILPCFLLTQHALPALKATKGPVVNIISTIKNGNTINTKMNGLSGLTREWAVDMLKYDIRVNAVITEINPNSINAEEAATAAVFLLSERSAHTTGQLILS